MANETDSHIGKRLREARLAKSMSQGALGDALGISFQQVQKYETGANRIGASRLWEIAKQLEVPVDFLFDGLDKKDEASAVHPVSPDEHFSQRTIKIARELNALRDNRVKVHFIHLIRAFERLG